MSIIQPDQREDAVISRMIASSETSLDGLPPPELRQGTSDSVVVFLWSFLLLFGVLMLLTRGPLNAPPFEQLTQYVCDPLPALPTLGNRFQQYGLRLTCHAEGQLIYQREAIFNVSNQSGLLKCKREGGLTKIWRMAPPGAYGEIVFHATCGDHIVILYKNSAANYESNQYFITVLACTIIILSAASLIMKWQRRELRGRVARK